MSSYSVRFVNARIGYDEPIIRDITLSIPRPGLTTILGPNGSGKTTLLRAIIKYARVFGGYVFIDGKNVADLSIGDLPRYVSYSPAEINSQMMMTVGDILMSTRRSRGWVSEGDVEEVLGYLGIKDLVNRRFDELSTGQKRLVLIARALASGTSLLLLDEPTSSLDLGNKYRVIRALRRIVRDKGVTVVATGHDIDLALSSDWVIAIKDGELMAMGSPYDIVRDDVLSRLYGVNVRVVGFDGRRFVYVIDEH